MTRPAASIVTTTALVTGLSVADVRGPGRHRRACEARAAAALVAARQGATYREIGEALARTPSGAWRIAEAAADRLRAGDRRLSEIVTAIS